MKEELPMLDWNNARTPRTERWRPVSSLAAVAVAVALLVSADAVHAKLTSSACLVQKRKAWITFRKCQGSEQVKQLKGKPADLANCQTKFQVALTKITAKATKATIACRYGDNGDGTVTDYDTGLQWEKKTGVPGGLCVLNVHCVNDTYIFSDAETFANLLNGTSDHGAALTGVFAGFSDWRLPTIVELQTILLAPFPCGTNPSPCIDPIFGPTVTSFYWSATPFAASQNAWYVSFFDGTVSFNTEFALFDVRAVRAGL